MANNNITINVIDRRNNTYSLTIPFIRYKVPNIELVSVDGNYMLVDNTYVIFGKTTFKFKATSVVGLSKIVYSIDNDKKEITLNGEREYEFSITVE
jgi:DNA-binding beta-propeller fold protein YncE